MGLSFRSWQDLYQRQMTEKKGQVKISQMYSKSKTLLISTNVFKNTHYITQASFLLTRAYVANACPNMLDELGLVFDSEDHLPFLSMLENNKKEQHMAIKG